MLSPATVSPSPPLRLRLAVLAVVVAGLAMMLPGAIHASLHCDEVNVFRHVTNFARGEFSAPGRPGLLWLALSPILSFVDGVAAIHAMRATAVIASVGTLLLVAILAARRAKPEPDGDDTSQATWSVLGAGGLLVTSLGWHTHAFEVRTDTYTAPLTLFAAALLLRARVSTGAAVLAGAAMAGAGLISQKSIYNAVALGIGWLIFQGVQPGSFRSALRSAAVAVGTALALVATWYGAMTVLSGSASFLSDNLDTAVATGFSEVWSLSKNLGTIGETAKRAPLVWGLAPVALVAAWIGRLGHPTRLAVGAMAAALVATLFIHRGFRPYFVASFEPYLAVLSGGLLGTLSAALHRGLRRRLPGEGTARATAAMLLAGIPLIVGLGGTAALNMGGGRALLATDNANQLRVVRQATLAFPDPVPYWDSVGLVPGYPETTFFGTGPTRTAKRRKTPGNLFARLARVEKPRFFIRNYMTRDAYLTADERRWVWRHYLPYRPNLYVLGGRIRAGAEGVEATGAMEVLVSGDYTVRFLQGWTGTAAVNGSAVADGDVVVLTEGTATLAATVDSGEGDLALYLGAGREPQVSDLDWSMYPRLRRDRFQQYDQKRKTADLLTPRTDPTMTAERFRARSKRHKAFQKKRRRTLAVP